MSRLNNYIRVSPNDDNYTITIGNINERGGGNTLLTPLLSYDDLKELRKVIRKTIKESKYGNQIKSRTKRSK